jgi:predicted NBD/HSP70 family sugar kinase
VPSERFTGLAAVLDAIRNDDGITQPILVERIGLGRSVVAQRVAELEAAGLVASNGLGPSTGGRAPRRLRLRSEAGFALAVDIAGNEVLAAVADLAGEFVQTQREPADVADGPEAIFALAERVVDSLLDETGAREHLLSVGVGMPGPVAFDDEHATSMPTMPAWDRFPTRTRLMARWGAPVWMENRVILSALGERRVNPTAAASEHMLYLGGGEELGVALVVEGRLLKGARGLAGEISHIPVLGADDVLCPCGNRGCMEAVAGRDALVRNGRLLAEIGQSPMLAAVLAEAGTLVPADIAFAADRGDSAAQALLHRSALILGDTMATLVNVFNPDLVVLGGGLARASAHLIEGIREGIRQRGVPAATEGLRIESSAVDLELAGLIGAAHFAVDEVFSADRLSWLLGRPFLARKDEPA